MFNVRECDIHESDDVQSKLLYAEEDVCLLLIREGHLVLFSVTSLQHFQLACMPYRYIPSTFNLHYTYQAKHNDL